MELLGRVLRVVRANFNHWLNQAEDPEKLLERLVQEMQDELIRLRQAVAQAIATQKRLERQCRQAENKAQDWYRRAQQALHQGDEPTARQALIQRHTLLETVKTLEPQLQAQQTVVVRLKQDLKTLDLKLADARMKKDLYVVRARSAQASQRMQGLLDRLNSDSGPGIFERLEERILTLEAQTQAMQRPEDPLEERFAALEGWEAPLDSGNQTWDVEAELNRMRAQIDAAGYH